MREENRIALRLLVELSALGKAEVTAARQEWLYQKKGSFMFNLTNFSAICQKNIFRGNSVSGITLSHSKFLLYCILILKSALMS